MKSSDVSVTVTGEILEFRCTKCRALIAPLYLGIDQAGDPRFSFRCPSCETVETLRMRGVQGLPKHRVHDYRGS